MEVIELPADLRLPSLQANNLPDNLAHCDRQCTGAICGCVAEIQYIRRKNCGFGCPQSAKRQGITRCSQSFPLARRCVIATLARAGRSFNVETASPSIQCHAQQASFVGAGEFFSYARGAVSFYVETDRAKQLHTLGRPTKPAC